MGPEGGVEKDEEGEVDIWDEGKGGWGGLGDWMSWSGRDLYKA